VNAVPPGKPVVDVRHLPRPSTVRYRTLIESLMSIDEDLLTGAHPLRASIAVVQAVSQFIGDDHTLRVAGVSTTLRRLLAALDDTAVGGKPDWLFGGAIDEPARENGQKKAGRRVKQPDHSLRGAMVHALSGLIAVGMKNQEASQWMEKQLSSSGARYRGKPVTSRQLLQWREQTGDSAPQAADDAVRVLGQIGSQFPSLPATLATRKQIAQRIAQVVARYNSK
jgi:hypothetical protein